MINLLSNAIRFSQTSIIKAIGIKVEVSRNPPNSDDTCLRPLDGPDDLVPIAPGEKAPIYVYVYVHDSGPGLKPKDLELLVRI
jgi:signal transduction histidine kinase